MKITVHKSPAYNILIALFVLESLMLSVTYIPLFYQANILRAECFFICAFLFAYCFVSQKILNQILGKNKYFGMYIVFTFLFVIAQTIFSLISYNETIVDMANCIWLFSFLLIYYPIIYIFYETNGIDELLKDIMIITLVAISIFTFKALFYNVTGIEILSKVDGFGYRYDRMRLRMTSLTGLIYVYTLFTYLNSQKHSKKRMKYLLITLYILFFCVYVCMTRMFTITIVFSTFVVFAFNKKVTPTRIVAILVAIIIFIILFYTGVFDSFLNSFSIDSAMGNNTLARKNSISYFYSVFKNNPIFGMGFVSPSTPNLRDVFFGPDHANAIDDIGIIGTIFHYGILGAIMIIMFFARMLFTGFRLAFAKNYKNKAFILGILTFLLISSISLSIYDSTRILMLPIIFAIFEYEYQINILAPQRINKKDISQKDE